MNIKYYVLLLIITLFLQSCDNEFDPNADWTETTLVYGLIDQDEDTTFLRIQRCFLGKGLHEYTQIMDSNCYAEGELDVKIKEWTAKSSGNKIIKGQPTGRELTFERTILHNKPPGEFFYPNQPVYYAVSKGWYNVNNVYQLEIKNIRTGNLVTAETMPIRNEIELKKPANLFGFSDYVIIGGEEIYYLLLEWTTVDNAAIYQPILRFYYGEEGEDLYADFPLKMVKNTRLNKTLTTTWYKETFKIEFRKKFGDNRPDSIARQVDFLITAGTEDFRSYLESVSPSTNIMQERLPYTNVNNGLGIFTSRRTKIKFTRTIELYLLLELLYMEI